MAFQGSFSTGSLQALTTQRTSSRLQAALEADNAATATQLAADIASLQQTVNASTAARITSDAIETAELRAQLQGVLDTISALSTQQLAIQTAQAATDAAVAAAAATADAAETPRGVAVVRLGQTGVGSTTGDQTAIIPIAARRIDPAVFQNVSGDPFVTVLVSGWYAVYVDVNVQGSRGGLGTMTAL